MPPVPDAITIGPHTYEVHSDTAAARSLRAEESNGCTVSDYLTIAVDTDRPHTSVAETLLHETLHACWHQSLRKAGLDEHEEHIVTVLAPVLLDTLRSNPKLVAFLTA